jgi:hypothetical protein
MNVVENDKYCAQAHMRKCCNGECGKLHIKCTDDKTFTENYFAAAIDVTDMSDCVTDTVTALVVLDIETIKDAFQFDMSPVNGKKPKILLSARECAEIPGWLTAYKGDVVAVVKLKPGFVWKMEWFAYRKQLLLGWLKTKFQNLAQISFYTGDAILCKDLLGYISAEKMMLSLQKSGKVEDHLVFHTQIHIVEVDGVFSTDKLVMHYGVRIAQPIQTRKRGRENGGVDTSQLYHASISNSRDLLRKAPVSAPTVTVQTVPVVVPVKRAAVQAPIWNLGDSKWTNRAKPLTTQVSAWPTLAKPLPTQAIPGIAQAIPPPTQVIPPPTQVIPPPTQVIPPPTQAKPTPTQAKPIVTARTRESELGASGRESDNVHQYRRSHSSGHSQGSVRERSRDVDDRERTARSHGENYDGHRETRDDRGRTVRSRGENYDNRRETRDDRGRTVRRSDDNYGNRREMRDYRSQAPRRRDDNCDNHREMRGDRDCTVRRSDDNYDNHREIYDDRGRPLRRSGEIRSAQEPNEARPPERWRSFEDSDEEDSTNANAEAPDARSHNGRHKHHDNRSTLLVYSPPLELDNSFELNTNEEAPPMTLGDGFIKQFDTVEEMYESLNPETVVLRFYEATCFTLRELRDGVICVTPKSILRYLFYGKFDALHAELQVEYRNTAIAMFNAKRLSGSTPVSLPKKELVGLRNKIVAAFLLFTLTAHRGPDSYAVPEKMSHHVAAFAACRGRTYMAKVRADNEYDKPLLYCANLLDCMAAGKSTLNYTRRINYTRYFSESFGVFGTTLEVAEFTKSKRLRVDKDGKIVIHSDLRAKSKYIDAFARILARHSKYFEFASMNFQILLLVRFALETNLQKISLIDLKENFPRLWNGRLSDMKPFANAKRLRFDKVFKRIRKNI